MPSIRLSLLPQPENPACYNHYNHTRVQTLVYPLHAKVKHLRIHFTLSIPYWI